MCHPVRCRTCGLTTWRGCGAHVAQLEAAVPVDQWCSGHPKSERRGILERLLRR